MESSCCNNVICALVLQGAATPALLAVSRPKDLNDGAFYYQVHQSFTGLTPSPESSASLILFYTFNRILFSCLFMFAVFLSVRRGTFGCARGLGLEWKYAFSAVQPVLEMGGLEVAVGCNVATVVATARA